MTVLCLLRNSLKIPLHTPHQQCRCYPMCVRQLSDTPLKTPFCLHNYTNPSPPCSSYFSYHLPGIFIIVYANHSQSFKLSLSLDAEGDNVFFVLSTVGTKWHDFQWKLLFCCSEGARIKADCIKVIDERAFRTLKSTPGYVSLPSCSR